MMQLSNRTFAVTLIAGSLFGTTSASAQSSSPVAAPAGWKTERANGGAAVFVPSDLQPGEIFKVAVFEPVPLSGKSPEEWFRNFAGPVGSGPGSLAAPLLISLTQGKVVAGSGKYVGPNKTTLTVLFFGALSGDGNIYVTRVLTNAPNSLLQRYKEPVGAINRASAARIQCAARLAKSSAVTRTRKPAAKPVAAEKKYPYVTAPGKGIPSGQIVGILHTTEQEFVGTAVNAVSGVYLLLRDGTTHKGLPVVPDQMDAAGSRRAEPETWGRWRRQGAEIQIALPEKASGFKTMDGILVKPGKSGQQLEGRFGTGSSSSDGFGAGSYRLWGVRFTRDGRFVKDSRGGASGADPIPGSGQVSVHSTYNDTGSVTSASGTGAAVSASRKNKPGGDRSGTYSIDGYVLTLRYDNGQTARLPFFFLDNDRDNIWFEDALLGLSKTNRK